MDSRTWFANRSSRIRRVIGRLLTVLVLLALIAVAGISWYFSGVALAVDRSVYRDNVATPVGTNQVQLNADHYASLSGRYGLEWDGGYANLGPVVSQDATHVVREFTTQTGTLAAATPVTLDQDAFNGDPKTARGLDFANVTVADDLGAFPAWFIPATPPALANASMDAGKTWVIFVHGHGGTRQESLRVLPVLHQAGLPVLVVSYRNDVIAPASPDGKDHLGDAEWNDVDAALNWAMLHGAKNVVLAGWSMGGAISLQVADRSNQRDDVVGLILDSPVVDWRNVFVAQGHARNLPAPLTAVATWTAEQRIGSDFDRFDWATRAKDLKVPVLLFATDGDTYVPNGPAKELAAARPDLVTFHNEKAAEHTRSWNVDPSGYESQVSDWLSKVSSR